MAGKVSIEQREAIYKRLEKELPLIKHGSSIGGILETTKTYDFQGKSVEIPVRKRITLKNDKGEPILNEKTGRPETRELLSFRETGIVGHKTEGVGIKDEGLGLKRRLPNRAIDRMNDTMRDILRKRLGLAPIGDPGENKRNYLDRLKQEKAELAKKRREEKVNYYLEKRASRKFKQRFEDKFNKLKDMVSAKDRRFSEVLKRRIHGLKYKFVVDDTPKEKEYTIDNREKPGYESPKYTPQEASKRLETAIGKFPEVVGNDGPIKKGNFENRPTKKGKFVPHYRTFGYAVVDEAGNLVRMKTSYGEGNLIVSDPEGPFIPKGFKTMAIGFQHKNVQ
ncbi:hypothetical protein J4442_00225, partial [Candidatus Woesearchaeota archaeon]|nr:hypothetical protein [Candidatus Woesearchaeota archaeon]